MSELAVTDSHGLIWYAAGKKRKLGVRARRHFERADSGLVAIYIPTIALVEIAEASRRGIIELGAGFTTWCARLLSSPHFIALDLSEIGSARAIEIVVRVTDDTTGQTVERAVPFTLAR